MKFSLPVKSLLLVALIVIVIMIPILIFSTTTKTEKYDVQAINDEMISGSKLGGYHLVKGLGFIIQTTQGTNFSIKFDMNNEAEHLMNKLTSDKNLLHNLTITYTDYLFGFSKDITSVTLSDGEVFAFVY
jgi:hypothetical protein